MEALKTPSIAGMSDVQYPPPRSNLTERMWDQSRGCLVRAISAAIFAGAIAFCLSTACSGDASAQDAVSAELARCDSAAAQQSARATSLSSVDPVALLNPVLLASEINRRKEEEARQPQLLNQIELQRQQCRRDVAAATTRQAQEMLDQRSDYAHGYKPISFDTFALDAKDMAFKNMRISMTGNYVPDGNLQWFFASSLDVIKATTNYSGARNVPRIPLMTDDATREFRKILLKCKAAPGADRTGCPTAITGHVGICTMTGPGGASREIPCVMVDNGRSLR